MPENKKALKFIKILLDHEMVKELDKIDDQGVKVSIHTYDVLRICEEEILKKYKDIESALKKICIFDIVVGVIIHDLSKGSLRKDGDKISHSQMMMKNPEYISKECEKILEEIEVETGLILKESIKKNIIHIVLSHHGKWGKIQPHSTEALIVHKADEYSAKYHRIIPIGADKILSLMGQGVVLEEVHGILGCTPGVIKDRLKRSKEILGLKNIKQLQAYHKKNRKIPLGDSFFETRILETGKLIALVEKNSVEKLILESLIVSHLDDSKIFEN